MVETAALLVDQVLPRQPIRQWVLSLPFALRYLLATRPEVVTQVLGIVYALLGASITYRIATGPREVQKVFTLQTLSAEPEAPRREVAESSGHAGVRYADSAWILRE